MQDITKKDLRLRILTLLRNQKEEERLEKSRAVQAKLFEMAEFKKFKTIFFYMPFDGEVDTLNMIKLAKKLGKKIGLPRILRRGKKFLPVFVESFGQLEKGPYGIQQPKAAEDNIMDLRNIDMVVVPGLAFDKKNYRLGRGEGYYDRFLKLLPSVIPTVGLAFDFQRINTLPQKAEHDMPVSYVLSN